MEPITNLEDLKKLDDKEIDDFFKSTTFRGVFTEKIRYNKSPDDYCGSFSNITIQGELSEICPYYINVPKSVTINFGKYEFNCRIDIKLLKEKGLYIANVLPNSIREYLPVMDKKFKNDLLSLSLAERTLDLFERWGVNSCEFIGFYCRDEESENGQIIIKDIHKVNFDRIPYYPDDEKHRPIVLKLPRAVPKLPLNNYYLFRWKLANRYDDLPFLIYVDFAYDPKPIDAKWFIDVLFSDRYDDNSRNFSSATNFLDTLSKQLSAKESTFIYELLQNANDYPIENEKVDVEFHILNNFLLFMHSGDYFNIRNISGICGINEKEKADNKKTIGYKGIGFKTVFLNNHYVYIRTGEYSFRFDKKSDRIKKIGAPWPILPIWTDPKDVAAEVKDIIDADQKFRVQIALKPDNSNILHKGINCYENLFGDIFKDSDIILFVPNINSVKIFSNRKAIRTCYKDLNNWVVSDYETPIEPELQDLINKKIDTGKSRIPEKYKDFSATKVSFACKKEGAVLKPIKDGLLYCYLPTSTTWGFPFLMNTDMIPKGDRDDIEFEVKLNDDRNFNSELSYIAGSKCFDWIKDLLTSSQYDIESVFSLIPNFDACRRKHEDYYPDFISKFRLGFEVPLLKETLIPIEGDMVNIKLVICDKTGLLLGDIMPDDVFYSLAFNKSCYLPLKALRQSKDFLSFLERYSEDEQIFDWEDLLALVQNDHFQKWQKIPENNIKFLSFLVKKKKLSDFVEVPVFLSQKSELHSAKTLYGNIDSEIIDLKCFEEYLPHLLIEIKSYFEENESWQQQTDGIFKEFNATDFIRELLSEDNFDLTIEKLKTSKENSLHFMHFLAINDLTGNEYKCLPFFSVNNEIIEDFDRIVFFDSERGKEVQTMPWLDEDWTSFVSTDYFVVDGEKTKTLFESLEVEEFTDHSVK